MVVDLVTTTRFTWAGSLSARAQAESMVCFKLSIFLEIFVIQKPGFSVNKLQTRTQLRYQVAIVFASIKTFKLKVSAIF